MSSTDFQWVNLSYDNSNIDETTRKTIRMQAMRDIAAARKKSGTWGKHNKRQAASNKPRDRRDFQSPEGSPTSASTPPTPTYSIQDSRRRSVEATPASSPLGSLFKRPSQPLPPFGIEPLGADSGLVKPTCMTSSQREAALLFQGPIGVEVLLERRRESNLTQSPVPCSTTTTCLDDALQYLATKTNPPVSPQCQTEDTSDQLHLYGKALQSLQAAIEDDQSWADADVLCAVEVLGLCEMLESSRPSAWESHIAGACRLIQARGPSRFESDFEKSLIVSMVSPIINESMRLRQPCFLEEPAWQAVLRSAIIPRRGYAPRCCAFYELSALGARMPRLYAQVHHAVTKANFIPDDELQGLLKRCLELKVRLEAWRTTYETRETYQSPTATNTLSGRLNQRTETLPAWLSLQAVLCRVISALSASRRIAQEEEAIMHAKHLVEIYNKTRQTDEFSSFYIQQKLVIAESILATSDMWLSDCWMDGPSKSAGSSQLIEAWKFTAWCDGRLDQGIETQG